MSYGVPERAGYTGKRALDLTVAVPAIVLTCPLQAVTAVAIWLTMGKPILFRQERPGLGGRTFHIVKFRTMLEIDEVRGRVDDASRLTRFGAVLRSSSVDELPSLWNVIRGEMSLVGPRPLLTQYLDLYTPEQRRRHETRPGLTGLAQTSGRNNLDWADRFAADVDYVDRQSLMLDIGILATTLVRVALGDGVSADGHATVEPYTGSTLGPL